jgi:hypothetical protein
MEIKNSEWAEFAEFIAAQSTWPISQYPDDGTYICCPFSTIERAYAAFSVWRACHSQSKVGEFYDVNYVKENPDYDPMEEYHRELEEAQQITAYLIKQHQIEKCYEQQYPDCTWQDEWDDYIPNREKQITRIAHELADKHEYLPFSQWKHLVYPFYDKYELNSDERTLFVDEYHAQCYHKYGHV